MQSIQEWLDALNTIDLLGTNLSGVSREIRTVITESSLFSLLNIRVAAPCVLRVTVSFEVNETWKIYHRSRQVCEEILDAVDAAVSAVVVDRTLRAFEIPMVITYAHIRVDVMLREV